MNITRLAYSFSLDTHKISLTAGGSKEEFPFVATITFGGRPSDGLVGGTDQIPGGPYRVDIPTAVLQDKIMDLVGKPVFASDSLVDHSNSKEIGEFMQAWVEPVLDSVTGEFVSVAKASGMLFRDRDPDLVDRVISGARSGIMGFSWDIGAVKFNLEEQADGEKVLKVSDLEWHGATVLRKETAAYQMTHLAASKNNEQKEYEDMNKDEIVATIKETIGSEFETLRANAVTKGDLEKITASIDGMKGEVAELKTKSEELDEGLKAVAKNPPKDPPKPKGKEEGEEETLSIKDFVGGIKEAMAEAMKPVTEGITELKEAVAGKAPEGDPESNGRKSVRSGQVEKIFAKYVENEDLEDGERHTVAGIRIAIAAVKEKLTNRRQRDEVLAVLSAERRSLIKQESARQNLGL